MKTMNKLFSASMIIILFNMLISTGQVNGQHRLEVLGGLNQSDLYYENSSGNERLTAPILGTDIGVRIDLGFHKNIHVIAGALYTRKGGVKKAEKSNPDIRIDLSYLEIPMLARFEFGNKFKPYIQAGPSIGILLDSKANAETGISDPGGPNNYEAELDNIYERFDLGLSTGVGVSYNFGKAMVFLEVNYSLGLTDIHKGGEINWMTDESDFVVDSPIEIKTKNKSLQFMAGVSFPLSK